MFLNFISYITCTEKEVGGNWVWILEQLTLFDKLWNPTLWKHCFYAINLMSTEYDVVIASYRNCGFLSKPVFGKSS